MILRGLSALWTSVAPPMADHLWQSTLFLVLAAILVLALRKNQARVRYWVWLTASVKFLIPFSLLIALGSHLAKPRVSTPAQVIVYSAVEDFSQPFAGPELPLIPQAPAPVSRFHLLPPIVVAAWLAGIVVVLLVWATGWIRVSLMVRAAVPLREGPEVEALRRLESTLDVRRPIRLVLSPDWMEPGIFGILRPVLIWPEGISQHLDDKHIDAILAHEICHARRHDNLTAILHMLVEAVFWFHPLVWGVGTRLEAERERACDEEVSLLCNQPHVYAESILKVCKFCSESPLACVSGITGADLKKRIAQIMTEQVARKLDLGRKVTLVTVALGVVAVPVVLAQAKAAQRMMLAAVAAAPKPFRAAAHAIMPLEETPAMGEIAEVQADVPGAATRDVTENAAAGPAFEVASIRPTTKGNNGAMGFDLTPSGRLRIMRETVKGMIYFAYLPNTGSGLVEGGPDWTGLEEFDVNAKVEDAEVATWAKLSDAQRSDRIRPMVRTLLAERFHLKMHAESQVRPVFALVQAKGGAKLKEADPPPPNLDPQAMQDWTRSSNPTALPGAFMMSGDTWTGNAIRIGVLMNEIAGNARVDRLVVDETGLKGYYSFTFKPSRDKDAPILLDQIEDQLGLKLEPRKVPVKTYVIDSVEMPSVDGAEVPDSSRARSQPQNAVSPSPRYEYEAATIKPSQGPGPYKKIGLWAAPDGFSAWFITPQQIISIAYGVESFQFSGGPNWLPSERFDIQAKMDAATTEALAKLSQAQRVLAQQQMLQALLADRFQLTVHRETKEGTIYTLVVAKGGPKLQEAKPGDAYPNGVTYPDGTHAGAGSMSGSQVTGDLTAQAVPIARLVQSLIQMLGHPVSDKTELKGVYDFKLQFTPDDRLQPPNGAAPNARLLVPPADSNAPSLFDALQEQLGLKLESGKGPVETLVVDQIEQPTEN